MWAGFSTFLSQRSLATSNCTAWFNRLLLLVALLYSCAQLVSVGSGGKQHDFRTYYYAAKAYEQGFNPYDLQSLRKVSGIEDMKLTFVYPPHTLAVFRPLSRIGYQPAYYLFLTVKILALLALVRIWMLIVPVAKSDWWALCVTVLLGYRCAVLRDLRAGNVSVFEQLLLWGGILLVMQNRSIGGGVSILLSSVFKLVTVTLAPLIVVLRRSWRSLCILVVLGMITVAGYLFLSTMQPDLWGNFFEAARALDERGNRSPSSLALIFDIRDAIALQEITAYMIYAAWCCIVLSALVWSFVLTQRSTDALPMLYLFLLAYVIIAPRMKDYSYIMVLLPTLHIISSMVTRRWQSITGCVLLWIPLVTYQSLWIAVIAFGLTLNWIWKHRKMPKKRMELTLNPLRGFSEAYP
jgi:hypothetical protein